MTHDFFTTVTSSGMLLRVCRKCGGTDFMERVTLLDDKGSDTGKEAFDWVPVYQRHVDGKATVTPRECVGESATASDGDRLQRKLEENRSKQANVNAANNSRRV